MGAPETGLLSELRFQQRCVERGIPVYTPILGTNPGVDAIIELDGTLLKVQVKTATLVDAGGCRRIQATLNAARYNKGRRDGGYKDLFDYYAFVSLELNSVWLIPTAEVSQGATWSKSLPKIQEIDHYRL